MSAQAARMWLDAFAPTSLGTGVAQTTLNGGNVYTVPKDAGALIEIVPTIAETGAHTAAESLMIRSDATSADLPGIVPKAFVFTGAMGGLGTFAFAMHPMILAYPYNVALKYATSQITFLGTCQIANTVAPEMSLQLLFSSGGQLDSEQFYTAPTNETNTGTAAGEVAGNDITINGGRAINILGGCTTTGVVTASEDVEGRYQLSSVNFNGVPSPQRYVIQPIAAALGTAVAVAVPADVRNKVMIPIGNSFLANTALQLDEALTATGNFILWVGYKK